MTCPHLRKEGLRRAIPALSLFPKTPGKLIWAVGRSPRGRAVSRVDGWVQALTVRWKAHVVACHADFFAAVTPFLQSGSSHQSKINIRREVESLNGSCRSRRSTKLCPGHGLSRQSNTTQKSWSRPKSIYY